MSVSLISSPIFFSKVLVSGSEGSLDPDGGASVEAVVDGGGGVAVVGGG